MSGDGAETSLVNRRCSVQCVFDQRALGSGGPVDLLQQRLLAAHTQSAFAYDRSAEFHRAVAKHLETLGDNVNAIRARELAALNRQRAAQEREYAWRVTCTSGSVAA